MEFARGPSRSGDEECAPFAMTASLAWKERMANTGGRLIRSCARRHCPNRTQEAALPCMPGHFRNAGLQQRVETWRRQGASLGHAAQANGKKAVRDAAPELAGYRWSAERRVLRRSTDAANRCRHIDSRGQGAVGFTLAHLPGFEPASRLKAIARRKLLPASAGRRVNPPDLWPVLSGVVRREKTVRRHDEMAKHAAAMRPGAAGPESILRRVSRDEAVPLSQGSRLA